MSVTATIPSKKGPVVQSVAVLSGFLALGMSQGIRGPTLLDLRHQVHTDLSSVSYIMTARAVGHLCGSLSMGFAFPHINFLFVSGLLSLVSAIVTLAVPFCHSLTPLLLTFAVYGLAFGSFDAGVNVFLLHLWPTDEASFLLQALQLMYGIGSLVAPVIAEPFLMHESVVREEETVRNGTSAVPLQEPQLLVPYAILSALLFVNGIFFFAVCFWTPVSATSTLCPDRRPTDEWMHDSTKNKQRLCSLLIVVMSLSLLHIYLGLEVSLGSFLLTFAVTSDLKWSKSAAAYLTLTFWLTFTLAKVAVVFVVRSLGNQVTIWASLSLLAIGNLFFITFSYLMLDMGMFFAVAVIGTAIAGLFGCIFAYLQQEVRLTSGIASAVSVAATMGEFSFPFIISLFIDTSPRILPAVSAASAVAMSLLFCGMTFVARIKASL